LLTLCMKKGATFCPGVHPTVRMEVASTTPPVGHRKMQ
jgi:hypothetical protein